MGYVIQFGYFSCNILMHRNRFFRKFGHGVEMTAESPTVELKIKMCF